ncbi:platelet endothelial cell adhesion molecule-like [Scyliorhinus canicula]|uniref:platelet endothelial cell adhesion molecule-like n=1 Tax=Scyliorhinus canicula TaxID=7830 RepID=UPI0018F666D4|nr:platelet endothelial cell adhesion molecule-like [Scyliorhinus canicula]
MLKEDNLLWKKMEWLLIILICSLPASGSLMAEERATGVVGRTVTISCHYNKQEYESHKKYWCQKWLRFRCAVLVDTTTEIGKQGRISIIDDKTQRIFTVTMSNLTSADTGWYNCGIESSGLDSMFAVYIHISDVMVSEPLLKFVRPANVSCIGGSVSVSCESLHGSLPITYAWYEKTQRATSEISHSNSLCLHCKNISEDQQYQCTASNNKGNASSAMLQVSLLKAAEKDCRFSVYIRNTGNMFNSCEDFPVNTDMEPNPIIEQTTISENTFQTIAVANESLSSYIICSSLRWAGFIFLLISAILVTCWTKKN